jgi:xylulokinase
MYFLGIDSGTQSTKAIVLDLDSGKIVATGHSSYDLIEGLPPGHLEQDPQNWLDAVDASVQQCLEQIGKDKSKIAGIGVSGQQHGLVALGADDNPCARRSCGAIPPRRRSARRSRIISAASRA